MILRASCLVLMAFGLASLGDETKPATKTLAVEDLYLFDAPRAVAFAPDGKHFASSSLDRTVRYWRLP